MTKKPKIEFYNTLTRKLEEFVPIQPGKVGVYSCGPTVYWNQHIGHMYAYVIYDTMVRYLRWVGYEVKWVINLTDVGHLTSDADTGEDKMEKGAKREGVSVWEIAERYIKQFRDSLELLNINGIDVYSRATEHIGEQIDLIKKMEAGGFVYTTKTGVVFDTSKFPGYADFARLKLADMEAGARVEVDAEKRQAWDFLLWITNQPKHLMQWDSPWGRGFPGWHIECTAMSTKYLGERFDIHTGGKEHIPVHHTNEIAQGYGAFGGQTANFWLHNEWLMLKGEKMSKSLGNVYTAQELEAKGYDLMALRYLFLTTHYRRGLLFSLDSLVAATTALDKLRAVVCRGKTGGAVHQGWRNKFGMVMGVDLAYPEAIALVWKMLKDASLSAEDKRATLLEFDRVLGLNLLAGRQIEPGVPEEVRKLMADREDARKTRDYQQADALRGAIEGLGWTVEDSPGGVKIKRLANTKSS